MSERPAVRNTVSVDYIDATPSGYALRILRHYRERCNEVWEVTGISDEERRVYDAMNEHQRQRAAELDIAIRILEANTAIL